MNAKELDKYFLSFKGAVLEYPFDEVTKVFKVTGKMFGLVNNVDGVLRVNLKGIPEDNITLRSMFNSIKPGYHMNKTHWNSLFLDGTLEDELVKKLIGESYDIIVSKLPQKIRKELNIKSE